MKHLKIVLIALITLGSMNFAQAQSKVAHIDTQKLIEALPGFQSAQSQIEKLESSYKSQIQDMYKELQEKTKKYDAEAKSQTDLINQQRMQEVSDAQQRIVKFQKNAQNQLAQKQQELVQPLLDKVQKAIKKVAEAKGYDYVLNSTPGAGVIVADGYNLMPDVKKELGVQ